MKEKDMIFWLCLILLGMLALNLVAFYHVRAAEVYVTQADDRCNERIAEWRAGNPGFSPLQPLPGLPPIQVNLT